MDCIYLVHILLFNNYFNNYRKYLDLHFALYIFFPTQLHTKKIMTYDTIHEYFIKPEKYVLLWFVNLFKRIFTFSNSLWLDCPEKTEIRGIIFYYVSA